MRRWIDCPSFNSKVVRLKARGWEQRFIQKFSFNSKVVRLKVVEKMNALDELGQFQFQSGAVKRNGFNAAFVKKNEFQFQSGAVKRWI